MNPFDPSAYSRFTLMVRSENIPPKIITTWSEAFVNAHFPPSLYPAALLLVVPERRVSVWAVVVRAGPFCCVFLFNAGLLFFCIGTESYKHNHMDLRTDTHAQRMNSSSVSGKSRFRRPAVRWYRMMRRTRF